MANIPAMTEAAEEAAASGTTAGTRLDRDSLLTAGMAVMGFALFLSAAWTARNEAALVPDGALYTARFVKAVACFAIAFTLRSHIPSVGKFFALGAGFVGMHLVAYGLGALMPAGVAEYLAASVISGAFSGIGEACVIVLFAHLFSTYAPRVSAVAIPVAYLLNEALYFSTLYLPTEAIMALRPAGKLLGVVLLGLCLRRKERLPLADNEYPLQYGISIKSAGERAITLFATHRSWALIIAGSTLFPLIFGFVAQACSRLSTNSGLYDGFNEIVALGTIALLVFYGVWRAGRLTFDELLYFSVPLFATGCLLLPAFWLADAPYAGMLVKCGYTVNQVLFWVLLAQESYRDLRHTYLFFGLFYGIYELTTAAARLTTSALYAEGGIDFTFMVYVALVALWLIACYGVLFFALAKRVARGRQGGGRSADAPVPDVEGPAGGGGASEAAVGGEEVPVRLVPEARRTLVFPDKLALVCERYGLTPREVEVLTETIHGYSMENIGKKLFVSRETVKTHLRRVYAKVGVGGKQELIAFIDRYEG